MSAPSCGATPSMAIVLLARLAFNSWLVTACWRWTGVEGSISQASTSHFCPKKTTGHTSTARPASLSSERNQPLRPRMSQSAISKVTPTPEMARPNSSTARRSASAMTRPPAMDTSLALKIISGIRYRQSRPSINADHPKARGAVRLAKGDGCGRVVMARSGAGL